MLVLSSAEDRCTQLFSKHKNYIVIMLQQIIQSRRLKDGFTVLEGAINDMSKWICSNIHTDQTKHVISSQVNTTNNTKGAINKWQANDNCCLFEKSKTRDHMLRCPALSQRK